MDIACDNLFQMANIVSINETHLSENDRLDPSMLGLNRDFSIFRYDRDGTGGGVAVFVKQMFNLTRLDIHLPIEAVAVKIHNPTPIIFLSVYRPPITAMKIFSERLKQFLCTISHETVCIVGDFNEDILLTDKKTMLQYAQFFKLQPGCNKAHT